MQNNFRPADYMLRCLAMPHRKPHRHKANASSLAATVRGQAIGIALYRQADACRSPGSNLAVRIVKKLLQPGGVFGQQFWDPCRIHEADRKI